MNPAPPVTSTCVVGGVVGHSGTSPGAGTVRVYPRATSWARMQGGGGAARRGLPRELRGTREPGRGQHRPQVRIVEELAQAIGDRVGVTRIDQHGGVAGHLGQRRHVRREHRHPRREPFEHREPEPLVQRRVGQERGAGEQRDLLPVGSRSPSARSGREPPAATRRSPHRAARPPSGSQRTEPPAITRRVPGSKRSRTPARAGRGSSAARSRRRTARTAPSMPYLRRTASTASGAAGAKAATSTPSGVTWTRSASTSCAASRSAFVEADGTMTPAARCSQRSNRRRHRSIHVRRRLGQMLVREVVHHHHHPGAVRRRRKEVRRQQHVERARPFDPRHAEPGRHAGRTRAPGTARPSP